MANDIERFNFPKCFLSETPLLLINHLRCTNANYQHVLYILKEYLDVNEIVDRLFQNIIDYTPEKNAYSDIGIFITRSSSIRSEFSQILFCDFSEDGSTRTRLMTKLLFLKYQMELKTELILLCVSRIPTLSALLLDIGEAIRPLLIKDDGFARLGTDRGPLTGPSQKSGGTSTQRDTSFQFVPGFRAASEPSKNFPLIIYVTFGRERRIASVNCPLDNGSYRIYLSGYVLQFLGPIDSVGLECYLRLTILVGECEQGFSEVVLDLEFFCLGGRQVGTIFSVKQLGLSV